MTLGLVAWVLGCGPAKPSTVTPEPARSEHGASASESESASAPDQEPADPTCPAVDYAALEPEPGTPDPRTLALTQLFRNEEPRAGKTSARRVSVGTIRVSARSPAPEMGGMFGMGWMGLERSWVDGTLRPQVEEPFAAWLAAREQLGTHQRGSYLLDKRVDYAMAVQVPESWGSLQCLEWAAARAQREEDEAKAATEDAARELREVLEALSSRSSGEKFLLAYLIGRTLPYPRRAQDTARSLELLREVVDDEGLPREQRARAAEQMADLADTRSDAFVDALQTTLALTDDPELTVETLIKLADARDGDALAEKRRVQAVALLDAHDPGSWQLAHTLSKLAQARLGRGAFARARDDAARCARTVAFDDFPRDPDPWGCAPILAEAIAALGEAPQDVEVPHAFLGPLALATMHAALARLDHDQARHAGQLLLAERPDAAQAPEALALLAALARTDDERDALLDRRARDYGLHGTWAVAQRQRLAWEHRSQEVESRLANLLDVSRVRVPLEPSTPAEREADLRERATMVAEECTPAEATGPPPLEVRVDTTGTVPAVTVRRADAALTKCLRRASRSCFRSVGPARVTFRVVYE